MNWFDADFLDELTDRLTAAGKRVASTARTAADAARTNVQIAQEEKRLRKAYRELGMYIFEESGMTPEGPMVALYETIADAKANIEELKNEESEDDLDEEEDEDEEEQEPEVAAFVDRMTEAVKAAVSEESEEADAPAYVCPVCGATFDSEQTDCPSCGSKLH